jgi:hypothetical protein
LTLMVTALAMSEPLMSGIRAPANRPAFAAQPSF